MLEIEDPAWSFDGLLAIVALTAPLLFLGMLIRALSRLLNYHRVPAVTALASQGAPIAEVIAHIDGELAAADPHTPVRSALLTPSWLTSTLK